MKNRSGDAGALPKLDFVNDTYPQVFCRGAALEVAETAKQLFCGLNILPPTDPRCVKSLIQLQHMATEIGIDASR